MAQQLADCNYKLILAMPVEIIAWNLLQRTRKFEYMYLKFKGYSVFVHVKFVTNSYFTNEMNKDRM